MPQIIKPTTIVKQITTNTVQGEITVNLNLTLTIQTDSDGVISVKATPTVEEKKIPDYVPQIPEWNVSDEDLIEFGKAVE